MLGDERDVLRRAEKQKEGHDSCSYLRGPAAVFISQKMLGSLFAAESQPIFYGNFCKVIAQRVKALQWRLRLTQAMPGRVIL